MFEAKAMIHSLGEVRVVTIKEKVGDNSYLAEFNGGIFTAIFNPFTCLYYVDDKYGRVEK